jgi:hypothetical protein
MRREDRSSISFLSSRRSRQVTCFYSCYVIGLLILSGLGGRHVELGSGWLGRGLIDLPHLEGPATSQNAPGDAGELVGEGVRSPVEICFGTSPSQAAKSPPLVNTSSAPMAATIALQMIVPMPGTLINRSQPVWRAMVDLVRQTLGPLIEPAPVAGQMRRQDTWRHARMRGSSPC